MDAIIGMDICVVCDLLLVTLACYCSDLALVCPRAVSNIGVTKASFKSYVTNRILLANCRGVIYIRGVIPSFEICIFLWFR